MVIFNHGMMAVMTHYRGGKGGGKCPLPPIMIWSYFGTNKFSKPQPVLTINIYIYKMTGNMPWYQCTSEQLLKVWSILSLKWMIIKLVCTGVQRLVAIIPAQGDRQCIVHTAHCSHGSVHLYSCIEARAHNSSPRLQALHTAISSQGWTPGHYCSHVKGLGIETPPAKGGSDILTLARDA